MAVEIARGSQALNDWTCGPSHDVNRGLYPLAPSPSQNSQYIEMHHTKVVPRLRDFAAGRCGTELPCAHGMPVAWHREAHGPFCSPVRCWQLRLYCDLHCECTSDLPMDPTELIRFTDCLSCWGV